jgi:hypothetical protein
MKSIRLRTQRVTIALEFPGRMVQASTAELFSSSNPSLNDFTHLAENPKLAECLAFLIGNGGLQAPHLDHSLENGNHLSASSNSADSGMRSSGHRRVSMIPCPSMQSPVSLSKTYEPWSLLAGASLSSKRPRKANCDVYGCAIEQEAASRALRNGYMVGEPLEEVDQPTTRPHG